jgi:hypothetical protein
MWRTLIAGVLMAGTPALAASIVIRLPPGAVATAATATAPKSPTTHLRGTVHGDTVTFADVPPGTACEAQVTLADGTVLQGVDMGWYSRVPAKADAGPLTDDDRHDMAAVLGGVLSFFNHTDEVLVRGTHDRAVMLVDLRRDSAFHSDKGDEVIWRPEVWYFENHHGGWEKVQQTDRNLRRERFPTGPAYHAVVDHLRWVPELGGLKVRPNGPDVTVTLTVEAGVPATRPAMAAGNTRGAGG